MSVASEIIRTPRISELVEKGRRLMGMVAVSEKALQVKRMELGRFLLEVRAMYPRRGNTEESWGGFLQAIELDDTSAWRYMKLAEATLNLSERDKDKIPTYADLGLDKRESPQPDPDAPPHTDADAPPEFVEVAMLDDLPFDAAPRETAESRIVNAIANWLEVTYGYEDAAADLRAGRWRR